MTTLKSMLLAMLMFVSFLALAEEIVIENLPSAEVREMFNTAPEAFSDLASSPEKRASLLSATWSRANRSLPIDNRAYLYALAVDLYNSLPADVRPQPRELGPDEDAYPPAMEPFKKQFYSEMKYLVNAKQETINERDATWSRWKNNFDDGKMLAASEKAYIKQYFRDQITQNNIALDASDAPASLEPKKLDITNPTHYPALREYMERMQPAIAAGVPPWEAEKYLAMEQSEEKTKEQTPVASQQPTPITQPAKPPADADASEAAEYKRWILILALLAIGVAVIVYILRRPRKK